MVTPSTTNGLPLLPAAFAEVFESELFESMTPAEDIFKDGFENLPPWAGSSCLSLRCDTLDRCHDPLDFLRRVVNVRAEPDAALGRSRDALLIVQSIIDRAIVAAGE